MTGSQIEILLLVSTRWLTYAPTLLIVGVFGIRLVSWRACAIDARLATACQRINAGALRVGEWSALALVAALAAKLFAQTYSSFGLEERVTWPLVKVIVEETMWGGNWIVQVLAALATWAGFEAAQKFRPLRSAVPIAAAVVAAIVTPLTGHSVGHGPVLWSLHIAHVMGAGLWLGTLAVLCWTTQARAFHLAPSAGDDGHTWLTLLRAFSPIALVGAALIVGSGAAMTWRHIQPWPMAWLTPFGTTLGWKIGAVLVVVILGLINWQWLRPKLTRASSSPSTPSTLRRVAWMEVTLGLVVVLGLTAILTGLAMPTH